MNSLTCFFTVDTFTQQFCNIIFSCTFLKYIIMTLSVICRERQDCETVRNYLVKTYNTEFLWSCRLRHADPFITSFQHDIQQNIQIA